MIGFKIVMMDVYVIT